MQIMKRNGTTVDFDISKISLAIQKAMAETAKGVDQKLADKISKDARDYFLKLETVPTVEDASDMAEELLAIEGRFDASKRYILYREERREIRNKPWPMSELQRDIYENKYRSGNESFSEFIDRVSGNNAEVAKIIRNRDFIPAGRILAGRGLDRNVTLSNCYVLPQPKDNLESIFDLAKLSARTYSYGGGVGFDISLLRPTGSKVNNSAITTSGPVSFMPLYSMTTEIIGQRGRRGALMLSMDVDHLDILDFINVKNDLNAVTSANISVRTNDKFFNSIQEDKNQNILDAIAESNWKSGEPGMLFWDKVQNWHLLQHHPAYLLFATNPCGEQPLPEFGSCLLGSINLSNFVINPYTPYARVDYKRLEKVTKVAIIGMNEILDEGIPLHPLKEQQETAKRFRQIGTGIMGMADMFIKLGIKYGSKESITLSRELGKFIRDTAFQESVDLAKEYGAYPEFNAEIVSKSDYFQNLPESLQDEIRLHGMRNSHVLSIAPTGSISTMWGTSGGIEPIFANSYTRTTKSLAAEGDVDYTVYTDVIKELMEQTGITRERDLPDYAVTSHEIDPLDRIKVQGAWQEVIDSAISSTINLNEDATAEDIKEIYIEAWREGLKGITVFRNNSWREGILKMSEPVKKEEEEDCST